ncbi:DUF5518 domain-containing protein [Haloparvum sedimenti]|uniref:DUF5518 domain-containing protein n=1 Tax=Haloparvum sedimenti TaxID=1678448 RepID=UPI000F7AFFB6|nr:DUF5518 domain-containing protein [Haloparvum sedimenti]
MESDGTSGEKICGNCEEKIDRNAVICPECGVSQDSARSNVRDPSERYTAAIIGSVGSFFLGWVPFLGPMIGGMIGGYLRGPNNRESALVGILANVIASIPFVLFAAFGTFAQVVEGTVDTFVVWVIICVFAIAYFYGLGAFGGWVGAELSNRKEPQL